MRIKTSPPEAVGSFAIQKKSMKIRYPILCLMASLVAVLGYAQSCLVPAPQHYLPANGYFNIERTMTIGYEADVLRDAADYLNQYLNIETCKRADADIRLRLDVTLDSEAYRLDVACDGITIAGGDYGGVFNGIVTLMQMLPSEVYTRNLQLPVRVECCRVEDAPRFEHRGFMLDVCRTWMDKGAVMAYIDLLAYHKINRLRLHLTDDEAWRIEIKSHPELAKVGGFRGGDSPIWPRYGKWNERWGGYYTQEDIREMVDYARVRNIVIVPEIDLPGHSLCMATMHPEILCNYEPNTSAAFGYDTRSAFCPSNEENYTLLEDIIGEICELFPSEYIHIGGDEVDMSQWRRCPDCQSFMQRHNMASTEALQAYFMTRLSDMVARYDKHAAVWNEAIDGGRLDDGTLVYGWESVKECRRAAAEGYATVVMPGQYFYFDMKHTPREPGHDWAAIFDCRKVYEFSLPSAGFTAEEQGSVVGFEGSFFSEVYASHNPENSDYIHYQTFPRMVSLSEICWTNSDERDWEAFYRRMVAHYDRLDAMGVAYRLMPPVVKYEDGVLTVTTDDHSPIYYRREPMDVEMLYREPIATATPAEYSFVARRGRAQSPEAAVASHFKTITPSFKFSSSMADRERFSFEKAEGYGRLARTTRAADVGDWVMYTFDTPVKCRRMKVATGNFQLPRYLFENGYVEVSYDGVQFHRVGELECGAFVIEYPARPIKAVRITCTSQGNGAEWVSVQPPTIWPLL